MLKRILVALSGTPYTPFAIEHAVALAVAHEAEVTGVTVTDLKRLAIVGPIPVGAAGAAHELAEHRIHITEERVEQTIRDFEAACRTAGITHRVERETGDPLEELMSLWRYHDITIFGLRGLFEYGVVHHPDDQLISLIKHGVRPLLAVAAAYRPIERVLIAYNGSMSSAKAMKRFVQSHPWGQPTLKIVCFDRKPEVGQELLDDAAAYCAAHGLEAETELIDGSPKENLLPTAERWQADLIVLGGSARSRLLKHMLGDVVLKAIRESTIPLYLTQ